MAKFSERISGKVSTSFNPLIRRAPSFRLFVPIPLSTGADPTKTACFEHSNSASVSAHQRKNFGKKKASCSTRIINHINSTSQIPSDTMAQKISVTMTVIECMWHKIGHRKLSFTVLCDPLHHTIACRGASHSRPIVEDATPRDAMCVVSGVPTLNIVGADDLSLFFTGLVAFGMAYRLRQASVDYYEVLGATGPHSCFQGHPHQRN